MKIGEIAKIAGCQPVTIRFYETRGLLSAPKRTEENYRIYGSKDVERLLFIRKCRALGLTLTEIARLIAVHDDPTMQCDEVNACLDNHLTELRSQIEALRQLEKELMQLRSTCLVPGASEHCGVLAELTTDARFQH